MTEIYFFYFFFSSRRRHTRFDCTGVQTCALPICIGYGARVGILGGTFPIPALSVSWMHRTLPRIQYGNLGPAFGTGDQFEFSMDLKADNYRAVASWKFVLVDLAAGLGVDHYSSSATTIRFHDASTPTSVTTIVINPANTREVLFADAG